MGLYLKGYLGLNYWGQIDFRVTGELDRNYCFIYLGIYVVQYLYNTCTVISLITLCLI